MAKSTTEFVCSNCGHIEPRWAGKCPSCQEWSTLEERTKSDASKPQVGVKSSGAVSRPTRRAQTVSQITTKKFSRLSSGIGEFDRVLGGGLVPGSVILLAGEPGIGKSTILAMVSQSIASSGMKTLYVSGEESVEQIAMRSKRVGADSDNLFIASEVDLAVVLGHIDEQQPEFLIVDSIQTIASSEIASRMGSVGQVNEVTTVLQRKAKELGIPAIFIGHVTKSGEIAGPRTVEHLVDVILHFEGDKDSSLRMLRGVKNRYGAADEVGCFEHTEEGIVEVPDPSGMLLGRRDEPMSGVSTSVIVEGKRPLPIEIQALVAPSPLPVPRKVISGIDGPRGNQLQAVTERHGRITLFNKDLYIATIGGIRTRETAVDLATIVAIISAAEDIPTPPKQVVIGEVTLTGEVRKVPGIGRRLAEAYRLGFTQAVVPSGSREEASKIVPKMNIIEVGNVGHVVQLVKAMS